MARTSKEQLKQRIAELETEVSTLKSLAQTKDQTFASEKSLLKQQHESSLQQKDALHSSEILERDTKIDTLTDEDEQKQKQLNKRELKKLAEAYSEQEGQYKTDSDTWFKFVKLSFAILGATVLFSVLMSRGVAWYERFEFYLINFVALTFLIFSLKQFTYFTKLRTDYANRKTLAQSYHNILTSSEDVELKPVFLEKAAGVLAASNDIKQDSFTLPEKLLETLAEVSKNLSKKI